MLCKLIGGKVISQAKLA